MLPQSVRSAWAQICGFSFHWCILSAQTSAWLIEGLEYILNEWELRVSQIVYEFRDQVTRSQVCLNFSILFSLMQILNSFESCLIPQLSSSPPDVEAMRIYLILPEFPLLQDSKYYITLTIPLAMAILRLDTNPSKVLGDLLHWIPEVLCFLFYSCDRWLLVDWHWRIYLLPFNILNT